MIFKFEKVKEGYADGAIVRGVSFRGVECDADEDTVVSPDSFEGESVTHIAYTQNFTAAYFRFHDWHHPGQGGDWIPDHYSLYGGQIKLPDTVKRIVIPATVTEIFPYPFGNPSPVDIEISPLNLRYTVVDNKITLKSCM